MPDFFMLAKDVLRPIAESAHTIRNLLALFVPETTPVGIAKRLARIDIARNPSMNQGKIFARLNFALISVEPSAEARASFRLSLS